jgi:hypothetical protein
VKKKPGKRKKMSQRYYRCKPDGKCESILPHPKTLRHDLHSPDGVYQNPLRQEEFPTLLFFHESVCKERCTDKRRELGEKYKHAMTQKQPFLYAHTFLPQGPSDTMALVSKRFASNRHEIEKQQYATCAESKNCELASCMTWCLMNQPRAFLTFIEKLKTDASVHFENLQNGQTNGVVQQNWALWIFRSKSWSYHGKDEAWLDQKYPVAFRDRHYNATDVERKNRTAVMLDALDKKDVLRVRIDWFFELDPVVNFPEEGEDSPDEDKNWSLLREYIETMAGPTEVIMWLPGPSDDILNTKTFRFQTQIRSEDTFDLIERQYAGTDTPVADIKLHVKARQTFVNPFVKQMPFSDEPAVTHASKKGKPKRKR